MLEEAIVNSIDNYQRLNITQACALASCKKSCFYERVNAGLYPKPRKNGKANYWLRHELVEALQQQDEVAEPDSLKSA